MQQGISTTDAPICVASGLFPSTETCNPQNNLSQIGNANPHLEDISHGEWSFDAMDSIFPSNMSFSVINASSSHMSPASQGMSQFLPDNHALNPPLSSDISPSPGRPLSPQPAELAHISPAPTQDRGWLSAVHLAARKGNDLILNILIQQNANLNEKDNDGRIPLIYAVIEDHHTIVTSLLAHGARISEVDCDDRSALHWAVLHRREKIPRMLLERKEEQGLDVDAYDFSGWTAMHMAVQADFEVGVKLLLEYGASINFKARKCPYAEKVLPGLLTRKSALPSDSLSNHE
jgi:hypothetical protein